MTCGALRAVGPIADNRYLINFAIVIDYGAVRLVDIATRGNSPPNVLCPALIKRGMLPPASIMTAASEVMLETLGATIRIMPEGAYVTAAPLGSRATNAGLTAGMVITKVNGIALAGMGSGMTKLLESNAATLTLDLATGDKVTLRRQP